MYVEAECIYLYSVKEAQPPHTDWRGVITGHGNMYTIHMHVYVHIPYMHDVLSVR